MKRDQPLKGLRTICGIRQLKVFNEMVHQPIAPLMQTGKIIRQPCMFLRRDSDPKQHSKLLPSFGLLQLRVSRIAALWIDVLAKQFFLEPSKRRFHHFGTPSLEARRNRCRIGNNPAWQDSQFDFSFQLLKAH